MNPSNDPLPTPVPDKLPPVTLRLNAPLPEGVRQRLAGHGKRLPPTWWRQLRALAAGDGRRWWWRAGDDEPESPEQ